MRYEATRLRDIATRRQKGRQSAEAALTMEFARFMFDSGLNPFVDPSVAGLRPDVLDPHLGTPIYVEAKQYATRDPRRIVVAAVRQVWDTWARLRTTYEIPEAFVLVFRLGGAGIVLPEWVAYGEQRLYLQAVDVAPAETSGSKQRFQPVEFSEDELGPLRGRRKRKRPR